MLYTLNLSHPNIESTAEMQAGCRRDHGPVGDNPARARLPGRWPRPARLGSFRRALRSLVPRNPRVGAEAFGDGRGSGATPRQPLWSHKV